MQAAFVIMLYVLPTLIFKLMIFVIIIIIIIILDSYIVHVSTLQGPQGAPTLPGYARLPISMLTGF